jgi:GNAT superfamily N-acetyltransferase
MTNPQEVLADTNIKIREAEIDDMEALVALLHELFAIEADFTFDEKRQRQGLKLMMDENGNQRRCIQVAEVNGQVAGMCTAQSLISTAEGGAVALIEDMVVANPYRKMGIGRQLMAHVEKWARRRGMKRLQLLADQTNCGGLDFYLKIGWQRTQLICLRRKW